MNRYVALSMVLLCAPVTGSLAASTRVHVYPLSQQYWDVSPGETLSGITAALLPGNRKLQQELALDIFQLNPDAFIDNNSDNLIAHKRLWLPNTITRPPLSNQGSDIKIEEYEWGHIKRISP